MITLYVETKDDVILNLSDLRNVSFIQKLQLRGENQKMRSLELPLIEPSHMASTVLWDLRVLKKSILITTL